MFGGRSAFDNAIRLAGGKLVLAQTHEELQAAINSNTAMIYTTSLGERLEKAHAIAKKAGVPMLLDDAAGIPPFENMRTYAKLGLDLFCFSGGKGLCGPQCSGLMLGRKDLIEAALANCSPWEGAVCRAMKGGKEEIMGVPAAVETWAKLDLAELDKPWSVRVERITVADCDRKLREGEPHIEVLTASNPSLLPVLRHGGDSETLKRPDQIRIISMTLQQGEDLIVGKRLRDILKEARR